MKNKLSAGGSRRLGFMIPVVTFVLFFVVCCGVVASVFLRSAEKTAAAGRLNDCIQLLRNQAEVRRSPDAPLISGEKTLFFDDCYRESTPDDCAFTLHIREELAEAPAGTLRRDFLTAAARDGSAEYTLEVAVYLPDGR